MRITDLYINGFGVFAEQKLSGFSSGVNVFLGNNEAGKSTCLSFLRYMLFGLPRKGKNISHYEPLRGGKHAGVLGLATQKFGALRLERSFKPKRVAITGGNGGQMDESALQALLGNVSRDLYTNVYGFSLTELQSKEALTGDAVRNALYGTVHGGGASYTDVMKHLSTKREALFKKGGKVLPLNKHIKDLEQLRKDMNACDDSVAAYLAVSQKISELEDELSERTVALRKLGIEAGTVNADIRLWGIFTEYKEKKAALEAVQPLVVFPQGGLHRFDSHNSSAQEKREQLAKVKAGIETTQREIEAKQALVNSELMMQQDVVRALSEEKAVMVGKQNELEQLGLEQKALQRDLAETFEQLGADWNAERVSAFDLSDNTRREVAQFEEQTGAAKQADTLAQNETARLAGVLEDARRNLEQYTYEFENNVDVKRFSALKGELNSASGDLQQSKDVLRAVRSRLPKVLASENASTITPFMVTAAFGVVGAGIVALPAFIPVSPYILYSGIAVIVLAIAGGVLTTMQRSKKISAQQHDVLELMSSAPLLFPQPEVTEECLLQAEDLFEDMQRGIMVCEALQEKLHLAQKQHDEAQKLFEEGSRNEQDAADILTRVNSKVKQWLTERGLSSGLRVQHIPETLQLIKDAKCNISQLSDLEARKTFVQGALEAFAKQQDALCAAACIEPEYAFDRTIKRSVTQDKLLRILTESQSAQIEILGLSDALRKDMESAKVLRDSVVKHEEEIHALFTAANAIDEESFRTKHAIYMQQQELLSAFNALNASLVAASDDGDISQLAARIGQQSEQELAIKASELAATIEEREKELEELRQELIQAKVEQEKLTSTEELALKRNQSEALKEEANGLAKEWARYRIAEHLLSRARERFEREQQPEVVKQAGIFFKTITKGAYSGVFKPLGEEDIFALAEDGTRRKPEELSRGTVEQLYLSLRLGHILSHSNQNEPLPVIMDDIMVNFDPIRAASTAETITELATHNQVFLFTCHPQTVEIMRNHAQDVGVYSVVNGLLDVATG
ncbi:AAA family ATPase [Halodesulfovibrio aestuarii]|uniref:ATP-binding protein n=1 Tax=Halodesulfovibrio aestuarii TaxID=126333 RepID=UPI000409E0CF